MKTQLGLVRLCVGSAVALFLFGEALVAQNPVAHWGFDEGTGNMALDLAGNNTGVLLGEPQWTEGQIGGALDFDGVGAYVEVQYSDLFQLSVLTLSAWVKPGTDLSTAGARRIAGRGEDDVTDHSAFGIAVRSSDVWGVGVNVNYEDNSDRDYFFSTGVFPTPAEWTHLAATRAQDGRLMIYANGELIGQWSSTPEPASECYEDFTIGANKGESGVGNFFPGTIDDVRLYDRALSSEEIEQLFQEGARGQIAIPTLERSAIQALALLIALAALACLRRGPARSTLHP